MPFLANLIRRRHFTLESFYSGVPSTTPAVQAEIFYGERSAVPGFHFLDRESGRDHSMYDAESAATIEARLLEKNPSPLLEGARAYSNIFRAGAEKTRYCSQDFAAKEILSRLHPYRWAILLVLYFPRIIRIILLAVVELVISIYDMFRGLVSGYAIVPELVFVPARVAMCSVLREAIRFRVLLDIERGFPFIQANFLGYDEQSHRRGPDSAFAHWTLRGIDRAIRDFYKTAVTSDHRDYELMVYSDHGQERVIPFEKATGRTLHQATQAAFASGPFAGTEVWMREIPPVIESVFDRCRKAFGFNRQSKVRSAGMDHEHQIVVAAMGPLGHIYLPRKFDKEVLHAYAKQLVKHGIPMVLLPAESGSAHVFLPKGKLELPRDALAVLGEDHPFPFEAAKDLIGIFTTRYAPEIIISGWRPDQRPISFPNENGAHAGPGREETRGFLLIPERIKSWHVNHLAGTKERVRGSDLGRIVRHYFGNDDPSTTKRELLTSPDHTVKHSIRVMTYNVHSCFGMDGKMRPERIARVINCCNPDLVGLQELDCYRRRSGIIDQPTTIATQLSMEHVFKAMLEEQEERYGIAIFSKFPLTIRKSELLTPAGENLLKEARGAIWVEAKLPGQPPIHFITTHFGLSARERRMQMAALLGPEWIGAIPKDQPLIVSGDFNSRPGSPVMKGLSGRLRDVQTILKGHRPCPTFMTTAPVMRIDHIYVSSHFRVNGIEIPRTPNVRVASDHLPLCVELSILPEP